MTKIDERVARIMTPYLKKFDCPHPDIFIRNISFLANVNNQDIANMAITIGKYSAEWAAAMESELKQGKQIIDIAKQTSFAVNNTTREKAGDSYRPETEITFGEFDLIVKNLASTWRHGAELATWFALNRDWVPSKQPTATDLLPVKAIFSGARGTGIYEELPQLFKRAAQIPDSVDVALEFAGRLYNPRVYRDEAAMKAAMAAGQGEEDRQENENIVNGQRIKRFALTGGLDVSIALFPK